MDCITERNYRVPIVRESTKAITIMRPIQPVTQLTDDFHTLRRRGDITPTRYREIIRLGYKLRSRYFAGDPSRRKIYEFVPASTPLQPKEQITTEPKGIKFYEQRNSPNSRTIYMRKVIFGQEVPLYSQRITTK